MKLLSLFLTREAWASLLTLKMQLGADRYAFSKYTDKVYSELMTIEKGRRKCLEDFGNPEPGSAEMIKCDQEFKKFLEAESELPVCTLSLASILKQSTGSISINDEQQLKPFFKE